MLHLKAGDLLKHNIEALLRARGQTRHSLAVYCKRSDAWISKIMRPNGDKRNIPLVYLDRIADFFGIATYQLFQPGISPLTERRSHLDRRTGRDRRISQAVLSQAPGDVDVMALIRALSRQGREKAIALLADILNDEIRRPPTTGASRGERDRRDESGGAVPVPARARKRQVTS